MLVVGAGGFAKENLEILVQRNLTRDIVFYDDVNQIKSKFLYDKFPILTNLEEVKNHFKTIDNQFIIGIGNPFLRKKMDIKFSAVGGELVSNISSAAEIGSFETNIGNGVNILSGVKISNSVVIGKGSIVYYNSVITHDVKIGEYVEISPNVTLLGNVQIGNYTRIGAGAIILPNIRLGSNVVVGAGAVVTKNYNDNSKIKGIPAKTF